MDGGEVMSARVKESLRLAAALERLWADDRFDGPQRRTRTFINTWLITRYSIPDHDEAFKETLRRTGDDRQYGWWSLVRGDAPCYRAKEANRYGCIIPKTRGINAGKPCGKSGTTFRVTDPATGEWRMETYCRTLHADAGRIMYARERSLVNVPEPKPNHGGLLPCYIKANNWPDLYVWANSTWKPPYVGICADDWPVMAKVATAPLTKVTLSALEGGRESAPSGASPTLRLVKS
jgi:hypothetical protein